MRRHLAPLGTFQFTKSQSTIMVEPEDPDTDLDDTVDALTRVFGIAALSRAAVCEKDIEDIAATALEYLKEPLEDAKTFKVEAKRSDKNSHEIAGDLPRDGRSYSAPLSSSQGRCT